jgi:predicted DNA-binding transcriptional regulator YafY
VTDEAVAAPADGELQPALTRQLHDARDIGRVCGPDDDCQLEDLSTGKVLMTFGENNRAFVFELLGWLGPGAELIEPQAWRTAFADDIRAMLMSYET